MCLCVCAGLRHFSPSRILLGLVFEFNRTRPKAGRSTPHAEFQIQQQQQQQQQFYAAKMCREQMLV
jgi:hypothetical protein